jgi:hypothetical protein
MHKIYDYFLIRNKGRFVEICIVSTQEYANVPSSLEHLGYSVLNKNDPKSERCSLPG